MRLAIAGFGNVGQALVGLASAQCSRGGFDVSVVAVSDLRFGTVIDAGGLDGNELIDSVNCADDFSKVDGHRAGLDTWG